MSRLDDLLTLQSGVVSRVQLLELGFTPADVRRMLRRRDLVLCSPGTYLNHTGEPTWLQQAWAGVLAVWPAALSHESAIRAADGPGRSRSDRLIHVAVDRTRSPSPPPGVRLHQLAGFDDKVRWNSSPPCVRIEHALIDVAAESRDELEAISVLADAVQARRTTAARLIVVLDERQRIARRAFLRSVLEDIAGGTCSVLEHGYLTRVERPHGLPSAHRQLRASSRGPIFRDVAYRRFRTYVELDGRLFHDTARAHDADLERDLDAAIGGSIDIRLGWGQVFRRHCTTAHKMGLLLNHRGWDGATTPCDECTPSDLAAVQSLGATG